MKITFQDMTFDMKLMYWDLIVEAEQRLKAPGATKLL
jgi:hypothetical protein